jgi:hypothetical protein
VNFGGDVSAKRMKGAGIETADGGIKISSLMDAEHYKNYYNKKDLVKY